MLLRARNGDRARALAACARLPTQPLQIAAWIHGGGLNTGSGPGALFLERDEAGLAFVSDLGVVMPFLRHESSIDELALRVGARARVVVGPSWATDQLWVRLVRRGVEARIIRDQVGYAVSRASFRADAALPGFRLQVAGPQDVDAVVAASAAMAIEESQDDPARRNPVLFRSRIAERLTQGRDFILREKGRLVFKVNVAALSPMGAHIEGVYTVPGARGRGLGRAGTAWITQWILERGPMATLLVNRDNDVARRIYQTLGFYPTHESRTVLAR